MILKSPPTFWIRADNGRFDCFSEGGRAEEVRGRVLEGVLRRVMKLE
jgi:hypothetical protein